MSVDQKAPRYVFIDALRGVACLGVLLFHLLNNTVLQATLRRLMPAVVQNIFDYGARGVQIFFVISGFVIAHSLRNFVPSGREVAGFILRRQLRLDPAYWVTVLVSLGLIFVENAIPSLQRKPIPSLAAVAANLFYVQNIAGVDQIIGVAWTLCIEIQFYLVFVVLMCAAARLGSPKYYRAFVVILVAGLGAFSLTRTTWTVTSPWFVGFWCYFAGGAISYWVVVGRRNDWMVVAYAAAMLVTTVWHGGEAMAFGLATVVGLWAVGRRGALTRWGGGPVLQYLGRISYSLYLIHFAVLSAVMRGGYKLTGDNGYAAIGWLLLAAVASVGAAEVLYRWVERPTMRLASSLKSRPCYHDGAPRETTPLGVPITNEKDFPAATALAASA